MADAVSKLYAEIGFKVNQKELEKAQLLVKSFKDSLTELNTAMKEAAREHGVFTKDQAKQELTNAKIATEASKKALNEKRRQILSLKRLDDVERKARKDALAEEKKQAKEKESLQKQQAQETELSANRINKAVKGIAKTFKDSARDASKAFTRLTGTGLAEFWNQVGASFGRSISTRNFMMATGMGIGDLQKITHQFANVGSSMSQEDIMGDILKMSQGLADISLAKGDVSTYRLLGVAAQRGDINTMIRAIGGSLQGLDNGLSLNMIRSLGGRDDWLQFFKSPQRYGGQWTGLSSGQQQGLEVAQTAFVQLKRSFIDLAEQIASVVSPVFRALADGLRTFYQRVARWVQEGKFEQFTEIMAGVIDEFNAWLNNLTSDDLKKAWQDFKDWIKESVGGLVDDLGVIGEGIHWVAEKLRKFGFGSDKEVKNTPTTQTGSVLQDYNLARRYLPNQQMTLIDNKTINTNINGVEQENIPETASKVTESAQSYNFNIERDSVFTKGYTATA